jgi:hypothetical protein
MVSANEGENLIEPTRMELNCLYLLRNQLQVAQTTSQTNLSPLSPMEVAVPKKSLRSGLVSIEVRNL